MEMRVITMKLLWEKRKKKKETHGESKKLKRENEYNLKKKLVSEVSIIRT